jgi:hypothetical protein
MVEVDLALNPSPMRPTAIKVEAQIASGWAKQHIRDRSSIVNIATRMTVVD